MPPQRTEPGKEEDERSLDNQYYEEITEVGPLWQAIEKLLDGKDANVRGALCRRLHEELHPDSPNKTPSQAKWNTGDQDSTLTIISAQRRQCARIRKMLLEDESQTEDDKHGDEPDMHQLGVDLTLIQEAAQHCLTKMQQARLDQKCWRTSCRFEEGLKELARF